MSESIENNNNNDNNNNNNNNNNISNNILASAPQKSVEFICDALRDLGLLVQFEKREKYPWRSVTLVVLQSSIPPWVFFTFSKFYKW